MYAIKTSKSLISINTTDQSCYEKKKIDLATFTNDYEKLNGYAAE